ncbi:CD226 antigen isoform X1 [Oryzias melastigma]|uniref:CD226 antigen isoform X1 n=1 Tax=Oryzias melastigma TaxID=30732 RepID=UPI000CF80A77|nr:CD226 antigen isoform X1 [Oryzias melastigma]XP_024135491.1 CD226 antigen isoform X1 [Oryzias melastigma]
MEAVQKDRWYLLVLLFLTFIKVALLQREVETVRLEEGMVLSCLCPWKGNLSMVSWTKTFENNPVAVFHPEFGKSFSHRYRDRVEFLRTSPLDGSISIKNVTHQDIGNYQCSVQTFPQGPWTTDIQVEDLDEPPSFNITDTALPEEALAVAQLVEEENNATIRCIQPHNVTIYQVILERKLREHIWNIIGVCKQVEGGLVSEDYSDRGRVDCADSLEVSLHLTGIAQEDSGFYRCTFNTDVGVRTYTMKLNVSTPGGFSLKLYMMYVYIGAGASAVLLLIVILILAMRRRKQSRRVEYRVKLHPSQKQPNVYENVAVFPRTTKKAGQLRNNPVYANLQAVRSLQTRRQNRPL